MRIVPRRMFLLLVLVCFSHAGSFREYFYDEGNICTRIETIEKSYVIPKITKVREKYSTWCFAIPPRCTMERTINVRTNETITVNVTRIVYDCCEGFEMDGNACIPSCQYGCGHGECIEPNTCLCDEGWSGPVCDEECEPNRYGRGCTFNCTCLNGGTCGKTDGSCSCAKGFMGIFCEMPCHHNTYGKDCKEECECDNGAQCDSRDGTCNCVDGYYGQFCEHRCELGYHGKDCQYDCVCIPENTHSCDHVDGKCICDSGYTGQFCERECDNFTYGNDCKYECDCINGEYCDPITGVCYCKPGWTGTTCSEECIPGKFGENCMYKCVACPSADASCNHVTGYCDCPPGTFGTLCDSECLEGYWGINCTNKCECINHEFCSVTTGECTCPTGWKQPNCSETCDLGWFGDNCSSACNCSNGNSCKPETGICFTSLPPQSAATGNGGVFMGALLSVLFCLCIMAFFAVWNYRRIISACRSFFRKDTMESISTERVIAENIAKPSDFTNPLYGSADDYRINQSMTADAVERAFGSSPDSGWESVDLRIGNTCAKEEGQEGQRFAESDSHLRRSENVNASTEDSEIKRNSKRRSAKKSTPSNASDFAPETLGEFKIPEDDIYDTIGSASCKIVFSEDKEGSSSEC